MLAVTYRFTIFALGCLALTACGGGQTLAPSRPAGVIGVQSAKLVITVDGAQTQSVKRQPRYLSPATQSISLNVTPQGSTTSISGFPQTVNLTTTSAGCVSTLATTQCTLTFNVPPGSYDATLTTYDGTNGSGNVLSAAQSVPFTISAGVVNTISISLGGVPTSVRIISDSATITGDPSIGFVLPTGGSAPVTVVGVDADGNYILGPGAPTVALTSTDAAQFTVSPPTAGAPNRFTVTNVSSAPTAATTLNATVTASAQTGVAPISSNAKIFAQSPLTAPTLTALSAPFAVAGQTVTETLTGTNFQAGSTTVNVAGSGVTVSNVTITSTTSLTAQFAVASGAALTPRNVNVSTTGGTSTTQTLTVVPPSEVFRSDDAAAGSPPGNGAGNPGDLRFAILNAPVGSTIAFDHCASPCTITLNGPLPPIRHDLTVDGATFGAVVIDGSSLYRAFFVDSGTIALRNLQIQHARAQGGNGGSGGGGGGAGLGAGLFVNQAGAAVSVVNVYFLNCSVVGGTSGNGYGAATTTSSGGGGGGGLGGNGGSGWTSNPGGSFGGGGGGGGVLGPGSAALNGTAGNGGLGGGAGGFGGPGVGTGGQAYAGDSAPSATTGGFGGGGGGVGGVFGPVPGGPGGFGGGGGGANTGDVNNGSTIFAGGRGGNGGPGGGGGGSAGGATAATGGALATLTGGNGGVGSVVNETGGGGGGAAAGPAIFVNAGSLSTTNSGASGMSATGGGGGEGGGAGTADATAAFNYAGTVNGSGSAGPVAGALSGTAPSGLRRRTR